MIFTFMAVFLHQPSSQSVGKSGVLYHDTYGHSDLQSSRFPKTKYSTVIVQILLFCAFEGVYIFVGTVALVSLNYRLLLVAMEAAYY